MYPESGHYNKIRQDQEHEPPATVEDLLSVLYRIQQEEEQTSKQEIEGLEARKRMLLSAIKTRSGPNTPNHQQDYVRSNSLLEDLRRSDLTDASILLSMLPPDLKKRFSHITLSPEALQKAFDSFVKERPLEDA